MDSIEIQDKGLNGLANINIELTSRCNKNCWMCGRRKIEREYPELVSQYGDMSYDMVETIAQQLPGNVVVQLHNNGEGLLYERFGDAALLFNRQITNIVTNGKLLMVKSDEIIGNIDTIAVSVFENDIEADDQYEILMEFLSKKEDRKPNVILRLNGNVKEERYLKTGLKIARRILHSPMGSFDYKRCDPTIPEIGICLDFLNHLAINSIGDVSPCVRFDPKRLGVIGNVREQPLRDIWVSEKRMKWLDYHKKNQREKIPLCSFCEFWGVPTGAQKRDKKET